MEDLSSRMPEFLWMTAVREVGAAPAANAAAPVDSAAQAARTTAAQIVPAELEGYAYSLSGLANLIIRLRESGYFERVDLTHAREVKLESHPAYSFALTCQLDYSGSPPPPDGPVPGANDHLALESAPSEKAN